MSDRQPAVALIGIDWGTTNRRAWAFDHAGRVIDSRADGEGLLKVDRREFRQAFARLVEGWRDEPVPVLMCGMVGSKLGWVEAPYLFTPAGLDKIGSELAQVPDVPAAWIVPGVCDLGGREPDVMRGEECQILGGLAATGAPDAVFVLPGTHSKWAFVEDRKLVRFRTYMTGELFNLLTGSGTIAQLIEPGEHDAQAFRQGVSRSLDEGSALLHSLFGARTLPLLEKLARGSIASYLSGLLIGAEFGDAMRFTGADASLVGIGSPQLLENYRTAAELARISLQELESGRVLPPALVAIARQRGLLAP
ncbi:MAG: 2-dehydro-3-deoxygalactonokinase [Hyphomicrobiales bacterium]